MATDLDKLAAFVNMAGGYDVASDLLGLQDYEIEFFVSGSPLSFEQENQLSRALSGFALDYEKQLDSGLDPQEVYTTYAEIISDINEKIADFHNVDAFREIVANGQITKDELDDFDTLFGQGDATLPVQAVIMDFLKEGGNASDFLEPFAKSGYRIDRYTPKPEILESVIDNALADMPNPTFKDLVLALQLEGFALDVKGRSEPYARRVINRLLKTIGDGADLIDAIIDRGYAITSEASLNQTAFWAWFREHYN